MQALLPRGGKLLQFRMQLIYWIKLRLLEFFYLQESPYKYPFDKEVYWNYPKILMALLQLFKIDLKKQVGIKIKVK